MHSTVYFVLLKLKL